MYNSGMKITAYGKTLTSRQWLNEPECKISLRNLENRIRLGWSPEYAISGELRSQKVHVPPQLVKWRGVEFEPTRSRYSAFIRLGGVLKRLGRYADAEQAAMAYNAALKEISSPDRLGFNILE